MTSIPISIYLATHKYGFDVSLVWPDDAFDTSAGCLSFAGWRTTRRKCRELIAVP